MTSAQFDGGKTAQEEALRQLAVGRVDGDWDLLTHQCSSRHSADHGVPRGLYGSRPGEGLRF